VRLPVSHWTGLEWLIAEKFIEFETVLNVAWQAWSDHRGAQPDIPFQQAFGYAIEEADTQYETWKNGFINDNK
jgi:hypothetical protein